MKLETRQKILIPIVIIMFIFVGWQVYNIFFAAPKDATISVTSARVQPDTPAALRQMVKPTVPQHAQTPEVGFDAVPKQQQIQKIMPGATASQSADYFQLMKEYQKLEAQHMLLQEKMAIAETKRKIAQLQAKLGETPDAAVVTNGHHGEYKLIYIDHQQGRWSATLSDSNNVFHEVTSGSKLADDSTVLLITTKGVVIKKDSKVIMLTFTGPVPFHVTQPVQPKTITKNKAAIHPIRIPVMPGPVIIRPQPKLQPEMQPKIVQPVSVVKKPVIKGPVPKVVPPVPPQPVIAKPLPQLKPLPEPNYQVKPVPTIKPNYIVRPVPVVAKPKPVIKEPPVITKPPLEPNYTLQPVAKEKPTVTTKKAATPENNVSNGPVHFSPLPQKPQ